MPFDADMTDFLFPLRVYWEDTDGGGIVYYANYLKFAERARTEWLRALGHDQSTLRDSQGIIFVVRECRVKYKIPAKLDDLLTVTVAVENATLHKLQLQQSICCGDRVCAELWVELVTVDAVTGALAKIPVDFLK
jgi:acyl-CoA thioester hydrolase